MSSPSNEEKILVACVEETRLLYLYLKKNFGDYEPLTGPKPLTHDRCSVAIGLPYFGEKCGLNSKFGVVLEVPPSENPDILTSEKRYYTFQPVHNKEFFGPSGTMNSRQKIIDTLVEMFESLKDGSLTDAIACSFKSGAV